MTRKMYDAEGVNAHTLVSHNPTMLGIYLTGSGIAWTTAEVALFPHVQPGQWVRIDQGSAGAPQYKATVVDCESGAYSLAGAINWLARCTAPRPTLYCTRSTLPSYHGTRDIWLAAPGLTDAEAIALAKTDKRIVAVQNCWPGIGLPANATYDTSVVIDPYWPEVKPVPPTPVNHEKAPAPPGEWKDAAMLTGIGLDGNLWSTVYNPSTGKWSTPVKIS